MFIHFAILQKIKKEIKIITNATIKGIQIGAKTQTHDQVMIPRSFSVIKINVRILKNPNPEDVCSVVWFDILIE